MGTGLKQHLLRVSLVLAMILLSSGVLQKSFFILALHYPLQISLFSIGFRLHNFNLFANICTPTLKLSNHSPLFFLLLYLFIRKIVFFNLTGRSSYCLLYKKTYLIQRNLEKRKEVKKQEDNKKYQIAFSLINFGKGRSSIGADLQFISICKGTICLLTESHVAKANS